MGKSYIQRRAETAMIIGTIWKYLKWILAIWLIIHVFTLNFKPKVTTSFKPGDKVIVDMVTDTITGTVTSYMYFYMKWVNAEYEGYKISYISDSGTIRNRYFDVDLVKEYKESNPYNLYGY